MIELYNGGVYLEKGQKIIVENPNIGLSLTKEEAVKNTMTYSILEAHNVADNMDDLQIKFDKLTSHDITFVGIIQTARASGLERFPIPYVLTNCHNSLCAVGGTINEDDHVFGLTSAKRYGGVYVPPHQAVIHQYAREMLACTGEMILGSDSHTRYGPLGTLAMGEGGPELVKQLLNRTYDIKRPKVIGIYLEGAPSYGVGPQDVALAIIGATFAVGYVNNKVMEFVGPGIKNLSADYRIGIDVMTTETTCLSSIWETDEIIREYYHIHGREEDYSKLQPGLLAYYDGMVRVDLSKIKPMIAMPFHPSNVYTIEELNENLGDILREVEKKARVSIGNEIEYSLTDKIKNNSLYVEQGIIAGCAGGGFENICIANDILKGKSIGADEFNLSIYPASTPIYSKIVRNGVAGDLMDTGAVIKTAFCGPCFGAGDTPANNAFSIRHTTRNFPNREGSKNQSGQIASVALMDARSIAATGANKGYLTSAADLDVEYKNHKFTFEKSIYKNRVFDSKGVADKTVEIKFGPNIKDFPTIPSLPSHLILKVVSEIHDPVTTTDELIPSGETSSYRSNPLGLAEYTLSRRDPDYVGRAKEVDKAQKAIQEGVSPVEALDELRPIFDIIEAALFPRECDSESESCGCSSEAHTESILVKLSKEPGKLGIGSTIFAVKPGDGSAREQAASCQRFLGGWANIANEYATKRYRSNLINWGMLPLITSENHKKLPFKNGEYLLLPNIRKAIEEKKDIIKAYVVKEKLIETEFTLGDLTDSEREIILQGCLINHYKEANNE
jgi:aconitate hydratase